MNIYPIAYFPPIPWFAAAIQEESVVIEVCQHFRKQQYTNRAFIRVANRTLPLTIPVERRGDKVPILLKKVSQAEPWAGNHWRTLVNAYKNAPYFEFYADQMEGFFQQDFHSLMEVLEKSLMLSEEMLGLQLNRRFSEEYFPSGHYDQDFRRGFDPSLQKLPEWFIGTPYTQVFEGFVPGLSILDLILNKGPESRLFLRESYRRRD
ncbi:MAG: WbqC family protein [Bacteroidia bacterium]|nr:WbqC family protein [Bacteroidia bacterium]